MTPSTGSMEAAAADGLTNLQVLITETHGREYSVHTSPCKLVAHQAAAVLRAQSKRVTKLPPSVAERDPNGLLELAICIKQKQSCISLGGEVTEQIAGVLHEIDPRVRLRARLHLEVLRIMHWCLFVLQNGYIQHLGY